MVAVLRSHTKILGDIFDRAIWEPYAAMNEPKPIGRHERRRVSRRDRVTLIEVLPFDHRMRVDALFLELGAAPDREPITVGVSILQTVVKIAPVFFPGRIFW